MMTEQVKSITKNFLIAVKPKEETYVSGSAILWFPTTEKNDCVVITCKHNLCKNSSKGCAITCGQSCEFLRTIEEVELIPTYYNKQSALDILEMQVASDQDIAFFKIRSTEINVAARDGSYYTLSDGNIDIKTGMDCFFRGFPKGAEGLSSNGDGFFQVKIIEKKDTDTIEIDSISNLQKDSLEGVSGSGVFVYIENKVYLVGILTDYENGLLRCWVRNPYVFLNQYFRLSANLLQEIEDGIKSREEIIKDFDSLIKETVDPERAKTLMIEKNYIEKEIMQFKNRVSTLKKTEHE